MNGRQIPWQSGRAQSGARRRCRCFGVLGEAVHSRGSQIRTSRKVAHGILAGIFLICLAGCGLRGGEGSSPATSAENVLEKVSEKGPVKLTLRITPKEPRLSDLVEMEIDVVAQPGVEITPPEFGAAVGDFLVRDYSERTANELASQGEAQTRRFRYQLEPVHAGRHLIRSIAIEFLDKRPESESHGEPAFVETDPVEIQVTSELGDQVPNLADLEPMLPPRPLDQSASWSWLLAVGGLALLAALIVGFRRSRLPRAVEERRLTPEEVAHAALAMLLAENLPAQGLFKVFYLRLTGIVRYYIEGTTGLRAPEQTTEEFLREIRERNVFPADRSMRLKEFLEAADMVKYAGQQPDADHIEQSIARAREFVALTSTDSADSPMAVGER